ncbi:hypothetical protein [Actinotalea sp.]|uniref:hypothetical protein n=1 Tax=Actinotalea sp. TaxID=1872145 RepID=UPI003569AB85
MVTKPHATESPTEIPPAAEVPPLTRTRESMLAWLAVIDDEGWAGPAGTELLNYVREDIVRPVVIHVGLRGVRASQAEATAWQEAWKALCRPSLRQAAEPWGVLWGTIRRAAMGESVAGQYGCAPREAWRLEAEARAGRLQPPLSLDGLRESGWDPTAEDASPSEVVEAAGALRDAVGALAAAGWPHHLAARIVILLSLDHPPANARSTVQGWRLLATDLQIAPWQARRLTLLLRGTDEAPGLLARLHAEGRAVLLEVPTRVALYATRHRRDAVTLSGQLPNGRRPQRLAS